MTTQPLRRRVGTFVALAIASVLVASGTAVAASPSITSLSLINADTGQSITSAPPFASGATLNRSTLPSNISVEAITSPSPTGSVAFDLDGTRIRTETVAPYFIAGDDANIIHPWSPATGQHTLVVTPYTGARASGTAGTPKTVSFTVTGSAVRGQLPAWPSTWTTGASAPQPRFESAATLFGSKIYSFGAFSDSQFRVNRSYVSYDIPTNTWKTLGTLPTSMAETHAGITNDGRFIYFAGGFGGNINPNKSPSQWISNKVWRYDPTNNSWLQIAKLPQPRGAGGLEILGRQLHYISGNPADRVTNVGTHYVYNLDTKQWRTAAPLPNPKDHFSTKAFGSKIYVMGGEHGHDQLHQQQSDVHVYDPRTDAWTRLANLPVAKSHIEGGTFVSDGKIVMAGGQIANFKPTSQVVSYDPVANLWSTLTPSLPVLRQGAIVQRYGNRVVLTMGAIATNAPQSGTWIGKLP